MEQGDPKQVVNEQLYGISSPTKQVAIATLTGKNTETRLHFVLSRDLVFSQGQMQLIAHIPLPTTPPLYKPANIACTNQGLWSITNPHRSIQFLYCLPASRRILHPFCTSQWLFS